MIRVPTTILVATAPVNLHYSFDRLVGMLGAEPKPSTPTDDAPT